MNRHQAFLEQLKNGQERLYAFLGEEDYLKDEAEQVLFQRLLTSSGPEMTDRIVMHCREVSADEVAQSCSYSSLFGGSRFIVLLGFEDWKISEQKALLTSFNDSPPSPTVLFVLRSSARRLPLTPKGMITKVFWKFFPRDLQKWVEKRLRNGGLRFSRDVPELLTSLFAGEDVKTMRILAAEIDKLLLYASGSDVLTADMVRRVCSASPKVEWFRFLDAVVRRKPREALAHVRTFIDTDTGACVGFIAVLGNRLFEMMVLKSIEAVHPAGWRELDSLCRRRLRPRMRKSERDSIDKKILSAIAEMSRDLPVEFGGVLKKFKPWSLASRCAETNNFTFVELIKALKWTSDAEHKLKSGQGHPMIEVDVLIAKLCTPGL